MARKNSSGDVDLFGQEETTAIPEDIEESRRNSWWKQSSQRKRKSGKVIPR